MFKFVKIAVVEGFWRRSLLVLVISKTKKITAAMIICCTLQFLFLKLLAVAARLPINNRNDCADTKNRDFPGFFTGLINGTAQMSCPTYARW
ncbi:hypothetical protein SEEA_C39090 [Salmonella enterica subsp. enterica serovar Abortusequi]